MELPLPPTSAPPGFDWWSWIGTAFLAALVIYLFIRATWAHLFQLALMMIGGVGMLYLLQAAEIEKGGGPLIGIAGIAFAYGVVWTLIRVADLWQGRGERDR